MNIGKSKEGANKKSKGWTGANDVCVAAERESRRVGVSAYRRRESEVKGER